MNKMTSFISIVLFTLLACGETTSTDLTKPVGEQQTDSFQMINLSDAEARELSETFKEFLAYQTDGKYAASLEYYPPGLFMSEEQKQASIDQMIQFRERGIIQRFQNARLEWASPWMNSEGKDVAFVSFFVEHTITLENELKDKAKAYETNVRDKYGKNNYRFDAATNTYHVAGPVKLFILRLPGKDRMYVVNEEYVMVARETPMVTMEVVEASKKFESQARKRL